MSLWLPIEPLERHTLGHGDEFNHTSRRRKRSARIIAKSDSNVTASADDMIDATMEREREFLNG
ncbi:hypothetical protein SESBI_02574 [Sesbania bispinosa]|nr:hypothetical protein SESBI_02574 [Sesbania bispinosa]